MKLFHTLFYIVIFSEMHAELYSALSGMEVLLETERVLGDMMHAYMTYQENLIQELRKRYDYHSSDYEVAKKNPTKYLSNPINAFKLIKKLYIDWKITEEILYNDKIASFTKSLRNLKSSLLFPDNDDLVGAVEGVIRLQDIYQLDTAELADGILIGKRESTPMTTSECVIMGYQASVLGYHNYTLKWMNAALSKYDKEYYNETELKIVIQEYRAFAQYNMGDITAAINSTQESIFLSPGDPKREEKLTFYKHMKKMTDAGEPMEFQDNYPNKPIVVYDRMYDELCRDDVDIPENIRKDLKCRYESEKSPFLRLAPIKVEEYYLDPYIAVFHDVIYEDEIKFIIKTAKTRLIPAKVLDSKMVGGIKANYRVTKTAWIRDNEHKIVQRINHRVEDITGLDMKSAEILQVANYGTAGHYLPHLDAVLKDSKFDFGLDDDIGGNRIATLIFYLSDVDLGGQTVFPKLGMGVAPHKGSALFWYNLHSSGETDTATLHGACPVLLGSKWVANKWIHLRGQEFRRLCDLEYVQEGMKNVYPKPVPKTKSNSNTK